MGNLLSKWNGMSLVKRIIIGLLVGIMLAMMVPEYAKPIGILVYYS